MGPSTFTTDDPHPDAQEAAGHQVVNETDRPAVTGRPVSWLVDASLALVGWERDDHVPAICRRYQVFAHLATALEYVAELLLTHHHIDQ